MAEKRATSGRFVRGVSGNPGGRPKDVYGIRELARDSGPDAIQTLKDLLKSQDERVRLSASVALLDRGYGKPTQPLDHELSHADKPAQECTTEELHARLLPVARPVVRKLVGARIESMTDEEIVTMATPLLVDSYKLADQKDGANE